MSISDLRSGFAESDQTLQNLLPALTLNLELRARYRVFEFEAAQDGHPESAGSSGAAAAEGEQIAELMAGQRSVRTRHGASESHEPRQGGSMTIGIVGLGYVGLPLAVAFAEAGERVIGVDTSVAKVASIRGR